MSAGRLSPVAKMPRKAKPQDPFPAQFDKFKAFVTEIMADGFDPNDVPTYRCATCNDKKWCIRSFRKDKDGREVPGMAPCPQCNPAQFERYKKGAYLNDDDPKHQEFLRKEAAKESDSQSRPHWEKK